jgi:hypothetical protein
VSGGSREIEVTARVVGSFDESAAWEELWPIGLFAWGADPQGSRVYRFMVDADDERGACAAVLDALLRVEGLVPHDIRPGPFEDVSGDDGEDARLEAFLAGLSPDARQGVIARLVAWHDHGH